MPPPSNRNKSATRNQIVDTVPRKGADSEEIETPLEPQNENKNSILAAITKSTEEVKADIKGLSVQLTAIRTDLDTLKTKTRDLEQAVEFNETTNKDRSKQLEERCDSIEFHQRKYNLIFRGVKAKPGEEEKEVRRVFFFFKRNWK